MPQTLKLLGSTEKRITRDKNGEDIPYLEITKVALVNYRIVSNDYKQNSIALYTFASNKSFNKLLEILYKNFLFFKTYNEELLYIKVWFTDKQSKP